MTMYFSVNTKMMSFCTSNFIKIPYCEKKTMNLIQIFFHFNETVNEFTEVSEFYKRNDAQTRVNLKTIAITLDFIL